VLNNIATVVAVVLGVHVIAKFAVFALLNRPGNAGGS
jgi:hypothetical protein